MSARGTAIEMPAQGGGPAVRDGAEHTQVLRRQPGALGFDEACPVLANDVGHLEGWPGHRFWSRRERRAVSGAETGSVSSGFVTACRCHSGDQSAAGRFLATSRLIVTYDESVVVACLARRQDLSLARWRTRTLPVGTT